jgi:hypothetical protein
MFSVIPRKKVLILSHSIVYRRVNSEARNGRKWHEKISFTKILVQQTEYFRPRQFRNGTPRDCLYFCSTERNSELFSLPRNGSGQNSKCSLLFCSTERNSELFLFRGMVENGIPRVSFYFRSMVQNSEHFSPLQKSSEWNSESFLFRGTAGIPPEQTNCSVYSVLRGIIFFVGNFQP